MKVSIALDDVNRFETELPENKAKELFNDFVFSAMSKRNKEGTSFSDYEDEDNFNTTEYLIENQITQGDLIILD